MRISITNMHSCFASVDHWPSIDDNWAAVGRHFASRATIGRLLEILSPTKIHIRMFDVMSRPGLFLQRSHHGDWAKEMVLTKMDFTFDTIHVNILGYTNRRHIFLSDSINQMNKYGQIRKKTTSFTHNYS